MTNSAKLYLLSDAGGRSILLSICGHWYCCSCAPCGSFGDVDIYNGEDADIAAKIAEGINDGDIIDLESMTIGAVQGDYGFGEELADIRGCTVADLDLRDNYEMNSFGDLLPIGHDITRYTLIAEKDVNLVDLSEYWDE